MTAVMTVQPTMTVTIHQSDFECLRSRTPKVANTTNGSRVKTIAMSSGMEGMARELITVLGP
jgi:hypothetical protein